MFDFSFGQLTLVLVIGLIVLGPERLPVAIKTIASWIKALRALSSSVKLELSKELKLHELQESLKKAEEKGLQTLTPEIKASIEELKQITAVMQDSLHKEISSAIQSTDVLNITKHQTKITSADKTDKPL